MNRFWNKVKKTENCWEWIGSIASCGYGRIVFNGRVINAHRMSWILHHGEIPKDKFVCHKCDNRKCIRPDHLFVGTNKDNMNDMVKKGRQNKAKGSKCGRSKLIEEQVLQIRAEYPIIKSQRKIAKKFNITKSNVQFILNRTSWNHI